MRKVILSDISTRIPARYDPAAQQQCDFMHGLVLREGQREEQEVKLMTSATAGRLWKLEHLIANYAKKITTNCIISKNYI